MDNMSCCPYEEDEGDAKGDCPPSEGEPAVEAAVVVEDILDMEADCVWRCCRAK